MAASSELVSAWLARRPRRLGPFVLIEPLGHGGFAPVWLAREVYGETELRTAAVKLFALEATGSGRARLGIIEEARALCRVEHPNVVRFYSLPIDEEGSVMGLAMEHVAGTSLDQRLARGPIRVDEVLAVGSAIASALSAVHRAGLVHRDVKPANVIEAAGVYKLIDFGIAAADALMDDGPDAPEGDAATVRHALAAGTVGYIDPASLAQGAAPTPAGDLYALGATMFELLTGRLPAASTEHDEARLRDDVLYGRARPPAVCSVAQEIPAEVGRVVDQMLEPDPRRRPRSAEAVALTLERLRSQLAGRATLALLPESVGPFRGLARFEEGDADVYYGRASEIAAALEMLRTRGLVALVGASGTGKSSLARAGVLPRAANGGLEGGFARWDTAITSVGVDPRRALLAALAPFVAGVDDLEPEAIELALVSRAHTAGAGILLLVDQLEELATIADPESRDWTTELLGRLGAEPLAGVRVLVTVRRDLLHGLLAGDLGRALARGMLLIEPMSTATWVDVLSQALDAYGYEIEDQALHDELERELEGSTDAMPLVQFAVTELWAHRDTERRLVTRAGLAAIGGIAGALERHAERTLARVMTEDATAGEAARELLVGLTTPDGTRLARPRSEVTQGPVIARVARAFEDARLLVADEGGLTLAHEALVTQWTRLRGWVEEAREDRRLAAELERDARAWQRDAENAPLWSRRRLAHAEELRARGTVPLTPAALAFLTAGRRAERRVRVLTVVATVTAAAVVATFALAYLGATRERMRAVQEEEAKTAHALADEQAARTLAEGRAHEVERAQARIDELLQRTAVTPETREAVAEQQRIIRVGAPPSRAASPPSGPQGVAPAVVVAAPTNAATSSHPAPPLTDGGFIKVW